MELGLSCCSIHFARPICLTRSMSPGRGPYASRFSACKIASSAFSSVIGKPLRAGSCFGFLSLVAGGAAAGEKSPNEFVHATERVTARNDLGVAAIEENGKRKPGARNI